MLIDRLERLVAGEFRRLFVFLPPGAAKALALDTPIPTPSGWRRMDELRVGDQIFDETGTPCNIVRVSPVWRDRPVYKVSTDCGDEIIADEDHEWRVRLCGKPRAALIANGLGAPALENRDDPASQFKLKTTRELHRRRAKRPMIERPGALKLPHAELPIDPYLLGVWLGDGHSAGMRISSSVEDQPWLRAELERRGFVTSDSSQPTLFGVLGVRAQFVALGLINDPLHSTYGRKYVPQVYMRASAEQRLELLQGLIDTDGTVCKRRGSTTFCSTNIHLAQAVSELVYSLGVKAGWSEGRAMLGDKDCGPVYRVSFYLEGSARMPRKAELTRNQSRTPNTYIDVEPAGRADTICIEVDSSSHLFLAGRSMTPTHNSTYASIIFPAWYLGQPNAGPVLAASHNVTLAKRFSRKCRDLVREKTRDLDFELSTDSQAADRWETSRGLEFMAAGVDMGIAGFRAQLGIIDDPYGSRADADSEVIRAKALEWWMDDFTNRLRPGALELYIGTLWRDDDLFNSIKALDDGIATHTLSIPAQCVDPKTDPLGRAMNEWIWDDEYGYAQRMREKKQQYSSRGDTRSWSAMFQQDPQPPSGNYFQREWFEKTRYFKPDLPAELSVYGTSDYAVTDDGGDYTVLRVWGISPDRHIWLLDGWKGQKTSDVWIEKQLDLVEKHQPLAWFGEGGVIQKTMEPFLISESMEREVYCWWNWLPSIQDKPTRARGFQARCSMRMVHLPAGPEGDEILEEYMRFPAGKHDDDVDCGSLLGRALDMAHPATVGVKPPEPDGLGAYKRRAVRTASGGWKTR